MSSGSGWKGKLSGPWVGELRQCWKTASSTTQGRRTVLDLRDVDFVDPAGEVAPGRHARRAAGVTIHAVGSIDAASIQAVGRGELSRAEVRDAACASVEEKPTQKLRCPRLHRSVPDATRARYETLLEVAESIAAHRQLSTLFADLSRCLKRLVSFDFISLTLIDPKDADRPPAHPGDGPERGGHAADRATPFDQTPTGIALRTRQPYYIPDVADDDRVSRSSATLLRANGIQSALHSPALHRAAGSRRAALRLAAARTPTRPRTSSSCSRWRGRWPWPWTTR